MLTKEKTQTAIAEKQTQTQILTMLAAETGLSKNEITSVLVALADLTQRHLMRNGSGEFKVPYLGLKLNRKTKAATPERVGRNPATGEVMTIAAKPMREIVKAIPLKALKDVI